MVSFTIKPFFSAAVGTGLTCENTQEFTRTDIILVIFRKVQNNSIFKHQ